MLRQGGEGSNKQWLGESDRANTIPWKTILKEY